MQGPLWTVMWMKEAKLKGRKEEEWVATWGCNVETDKPINFILRHWNQPCPYALAYNLFPPWLEVMPRFELRQSSDSHLSNRSRFRPTHPRGYNRTNPITANQDLPQIQVANNGLQWELSKTIWNIITTIWRMLWFDKRHMFIRAKRRYDSKKELNFMLMKTKDLNSKCHVIVLEFMTCWI